MIGADVVRAVMFLAAAATIAADGPVWVVLTLVTLTTLSGMAFRPAYQAILRGLARTPEELTAANVATSLINSVGAVVGPAIGGLLLAVSSTAAVFALNGVSFIWSAALVVAVRELERGGQAHEARSPVGAEAAAGVAALFADGRRRLLTLLYIAQATVAGTFGLHRRHGDRSGRSRGVRSRAAHCGHGDQGLVGGALALAVVARGASPPSSPSGSRSGAPRSRRWRSGAGNRLRSLAAGQPREHARGRTGDDMMQRLVPDAVTVPVRSGHCTAFSSGARIGCAARTIRRRRSWSSLGTRGRGSVAADTRAAHAEQAARDRPCRKYPPPRHCSRRPDVRRAPRVGAGATRRRVQGGASPPGEDVFHEGDPGDRFYVVKWGRSR